MQNSSELVKISLGLSRSVSVVARVVDEHLAEVPNSGLIILDGGSSLHIVVWGNHVSLMSRRVDPLIYCFSSSGTRVSTIVVGDVFSCTINLVAFFAHVVHSVLETVMVDGGILSHILGMLVALIMKVFIPKLWCRLRSLLGSVVICQSDNIDSGFNRGAVLFVTGAFTELRRASFLFLLIFLDLFGRRFLLRIFISFFLSWSFLGWLLLLFVEVKCTFSFRILNFSFLDGICGGCGLKGSGKLLGIQDLTISGSSVSNVLDNVDVVLLFLVDVILAHALLGEASLDLGPVDPVVITTALGHDFVCFCALVFLHVCLPLCGKSLQGFCTGSPVGGHPLLHIHLRVRAVKVLGLLDKGSVHHLERRGGSGKANQSGVNSKSHPKI